MRDLEQTQTVSGSNGVSPTGSSDAHGSSGGRSALLQRVHAEKYRSPSQISYTFFSKKDLKRACNSSGWPCMTWVPPPFPPSCAVVVVCCVFPARMIPVVSCAVAQGRRHGKGPRRSGEASAALETLEALLPRSMRRGSLFDNIPRRLWYTWYISSVRSPHG